MNIGLIGAPKAGKDVVADFFVHCGYRKFAFADKIKEGYYRESGYNETEFKDGRGKDVEKIIRAGLWAYSSRKKLEYGNNYFIAPVIEEIDKKDKNVIADVRTIQELQSLLKIGVDFLFVTRDFDRDMSGQVIPGTQISPRCVEKYCSVFINNYNTIEDAWDALRRSYMDLDSHRI